MTLRPRHGPHRGDRLAPGGNSAVIALLFVGLFVVVGVVAVVRHETSQHAGGDPGGRIMAVLREAKAAVPEGAHVLLLQDDGPHWDSCDGRDGTFGWDDVTYYVRFTSDMPAPEVFRAADAALLVEGWTRTGGDGNAFGSWSPAGTRLAGAEARLSYDVQSRVWGLIATAPPVGRPSSGC